METLFRDKILVCAECNNEFVYTVGQQRAAFEETGSLDEPEFCPVCSVKVERMGRQSMDTSLAGDEMRARRVNGYRAPSREAEDHTNGAADSLRAREEAPGSVVWSEQENRPEGQGQVDSRTAASSNRPADYRSGPEHPLFGHSGEQFMGHVKWFNDRKGFGFITLDDGTEIFVHYSGIQGNGYKTLKQEQRVQLVVEDTDKGPQASQVTVLSEEAPPLEETEAVAHGGETNWEQPVEAWGDANPMATDAPMSTNGLLDEPGDESILE